MTPLLIRAVWLAPMDGRLIRDGAVLVRDGLVAEVGAFADLRRASATVEDAGKVVLLPGLVNAHVHLELSDCRPGEKPSDGLEGWLIRMLTRTRLDADELHRRSAAGAKAGLAQCVKFGVTCVGDISRQPQITRPIARDGPVHVTSFGEVMAMAKRRGLVEERLVMATDRISESAYLRCGISPHAPYSVETTGYARCVQEAKRQGMSLATHLAETRAEWVFLAEHGGALRALWDTWLTWDDHVPRFAGGPIRMAREMGLLDYPSVLAHVNYCDDEELAILSAGRASVVYCPRTHAYFGHPPHRFREMMQCGMNVAAGTDSCASSPDLNLVDDLRFLHTAYPEIPAEPLWQMATINGAKALWAQEHAGSLTPGKRADMVAFAVTGDDPLREVLEGLGLPQRVWFSGEAYGEGERADG